MKSLYHSYYRFYKPHQKPEKILAISDVHFAGQISADMRRTADFAAKYAPSLITISGDLVDNLDAINTEKERAALKKWLTEMAAIAPVCLCIGNHDYYRKGPNFKSAINRKGYGYITVEPTAIKDLAAEVENVHFLDNEFYMDGSNCVYGFTLPADYYDCELHPGTEELSLFEAELEKVAASFEKLPKHKTKIILIHSPAFLKEPSIRKHLENFDFILAGHMHNGIVPPLLHEIWRGHSGIATPTKKFFRDHNTRLGLYDNQFIGLGAVTTVHKGSKPFGWANTLFPTYVATIEVGHNIADERKPDVKNKYEK